MNKKKALICGVSGQDGAYLSKFLLDKGYEVYGTSRDAQLSHFSGLSYLGIKDKVHVLSMSLTDFRSVLQVLTSVKPDEIYNLAGQSSVGLSFEQPVETMESISLGVLNLLEAIRFVDSSIKFYNAGSSEVFGDTGGTPADENTTFRPLSPYAVAKATATWQVSVYRKSYGLFACTGILFNHESPLRPNRYVTQKIVSTACRIANGIEKNLILGNIDIKRDWGWAPDYVDAMWRMMNLDEPQDFVIATGQSNTLKDFVSTVFSELDMNWEDYVVQNQDLLRPSEIMNISANPSKAEELLSWKAKCRMKDVSSNMIKHQLKKQRR
jgi:GDPmannose 4,6-dehydratase